MTRRRYEIISTCFDKRGRVLATAKNDYDKSHTLFKHFAVLAGESPDKHYRHAEFNACLKSRGRDIHSILVQRFDAEGNPALAKPCKTCQLVLKSFGVKLVRYTTKEGVKEYEV
jgi:hypothetical protein